MNKNGKFLFIALMAVLLLFAIGFSVAGKGGNGNGGGGGGGPKACNNNIDDDGDGLIDHPADPGCSKKNDNDENNCGNALIDGTEVCDGSELGGETCSSQGFLGGDLACNAQCNGFDTSQCYSQVCGNGIKEGTEVCDGTDLGGETCSSQGFDGGTLVCNSGCDGFDTNACWDNSCSDTDNGVDVFTQGTVSGDFEGSAYSNTDSCLDSVTVREHYCSGSLAQDTDFDCSLNVTGCSNGACF